jgi:hypothetical protein
MRVEEFMTVDGQAQISWLVLPIAIFAPHE